jgi:hypothetical protein
MHALLLLVALQAAAPAQPPEEARIPFANFRSIRGFHPVGEDVVYLQDQQRAWYRATLSGPCFNIGTALRIGLDTRPGGTVDNTSSFIADGQRCPIHSLMRSDPPPGRRR